MTGSEREVLVFCADHKRQKRCMVARFVWDEMQQKWTCLPPARSGPEGRQFTGAKSPLIYLDGNDRVLETPSRVGKALRDPEERVRINVHLQCRLCPRNLRKRLNDVTPFIDKASHADITELSLRELVAIVG